MRIMRLYTGSDGQSHLEPLPVSFLGTGPMQQSEARKASETAFIRMEPGTFFDFHTAPKRQFIITLSGMVEIGLGDSTLHRFGPGEGVLEEDLTGQGHTTRLVGDEARICMIIPVAD